MRKPPPHLDLSKLRMLKIKMHNGSQLKLFEYKMGDQNNNTQNHTSWCWGRWLSKETIIKKISHLELERTQPLSVNETLGQIFEWKPLQTKTKAWPELSIQNSMTDLWFNRCFHEQSTSHAKQNPKIHDPEKEHWANKWLFKYHEHE